MRRMWVRHILIYFNHLNSLSLIAPYFIPYRWGGMDRTDKNKWLVGEVALQFGLARRKTYKTDKTTPRSPRPLVPPFELKGCRRFEWLS